MRDQADRASFFATYFVSFPIHCFTTSRSLFIEGVAAVNRKVDQIIEEIEIPARARQSRKKGGDDDESSTTE